MVPDGRSCCKEICSPQNGNTGQMGWCKRSRSVTRGSETINFKEMQSANPVHTICFVELTIDRRYAATEESYFLG